ncbi:hypothetical protein SLS60_004321 [Paraconiothyrium brasiliense]|uniref:Uncharacterized protein n=1 Tax=Paraconiothyrium brasiliense TaxID=300254 RepID=A0ABR3RK08_9PLEO
MATHEAQMSFLEPWPAPSEKEPPYVRGKVEDGFPSQNFQNQEYNVKVTDARPNKDSFTLDKNGFTWHHDDNLSTDVLRAIRSKSKELVAEQYYPLVENIIKGATGASRVLIFDHTYRKRDPALNMKENPNGREQPATVHWAQAVASSDTQEKTLKDF